MDVDFSDILQQSRALRDRQEANSTVFADSIPRLERALPQIDKESRRLVASAHPAADGTEATPAPGTAESDALALRFLSEHGIPTGNLAETLQTGALLEDAFTAYPAENDTDIPAFLARLQEDCVVSAIHTALQRTKTVALSAISAGIDSDWDASKRDRIALPTLRTTSRRPSAVQEPAPAPGGAFASPFRLANDHGGGATSRAAPATSPIYQSIVRQAVYSRRNPTCALDVATQFDNTLLALLAPRQDAHNATRSVQNLHFVFTALRYITGEADASVPQREGVYAQLHLPHDKRRACLGALRFLCLQFREDKVRREIELRPVEAARGGMPGILGDVRAYINLSFGRGVPDQFAGGPVLHGQPLWPQVYYCLRAGDVSAAHGVLLEAVRSGGANGSVVLMEECVAAFVASGDRRQLPDDLLMRLVQDFGLTARRGTDYFHRVCCVIIARLDPAAGDRMVLPDSDYAYLFSSIEDYLWLRLSIARIDGDSAPPGALATYTLPLRAVQTEMREFGPNHFDPRGDAPVFYAFVLLLTGQFAQAIAYLDSGANAFAEAVHIAFVLYFYGMLRDAHDDADLPDSEAEAGSALDDACLRIDYPDLLWRYVSRFSAQDPASAVVYLFTIRNGAVRNAYLKRLLLETHELTLLVGAAPLATPDAARGKSVLEEMWPLSGQDGAASGGWLAVVEDAAVSAEESGDAAAAMQLYDVCAAYGKVVKLLIDRLGAELTARGSPVRERVLADARAYQAKLTARGVGGARSRSRDALLDRCGPSFQALLQLASFFDHVWAREHAAAWRLLTSIGILPVREEQLVSKTQELRAGSSGIWVDKLCERVPEILLAAMECIAALYSAQQRGRADAGRAHSSAELKAAARILVNFSGMMPQQSADVSARLVRLEVLMT